MRWRSKDGLSMATGRHWPESARRQRPKTIEDLAKRATAEADIKPVQVQLRLTDRCWEIKPLHAGGGEPPGKEAADTGRLCQEGINAWSVFLLVFQSRP